MKNKKSQNVKLKDYSENSSVFEKIKGSFWLIMIPWLLKYALFPKISVVRSLKVLLCAFLYFRLLYLSFVASLVAQLVKNLLAMQKT